MSTPKKYCPAFPGMLFLVCGMSNAEISAISSIPMSAVQNILVRKFGRTRREKRETAKLIRTSNCSTKYCRALVGMLIGVIGMSTREVADYCDMPIQSVNNILRRNFKELKADICRTYLKDIDIDALEAEYLAGASTYELGEKYGVAHQTIGKWMATRGHVRGKGYTTQEGTNKGHETQTQRAIERDKQRLLVEGGKIELVEYGGQRSTYRCVDCGFVFKRCRGYKSQVTCPNCRNRELQDIRERNGGKIFETGGHRARCKRYGRKYDKDVTKKKLIKRDKNICQICGEPCDSSDKRWGHFGPLTPTIDHIVALANGGDHVWENVQLAHAICNIIKNDLIEEELTEEVITHAKEQAIAYKCA